MSIYNTYLDKWLKKQSKIEFRLYKFESVFYAGEYTTGYTVIWKDKHNKVKIGHVYDGMNTRHGIQTFAWLRDGVVWNFSPYNPVDSDQLEAMKKVENGTSELPIFKMDSLKNLEY